MLKEETADRETVSTKAFFDFDAEWRATKHLAVNIFTNTEDGSWVWRT